MHDLAEAERLLREMVRCLPDGADFAWWNLSKELRETWKSTRAFLARLDGEGKP